MPLIDLQPWFHGTADDRAAVARRVDEALCTSGFLLITGHEVPTPVRAAARAAAREFFSRGSGSGSAATRCPPG